MKRRANRDRRPSQFRKWSRALWVTLVTPNAKQSEAYGRYCHTLSAAGVIGALTLLFSESPATHSIALRALAMFLAAVILFVFGTLAVRGNDAR